MAFGNLKLMAWQSRVDRLNAARKQLGLPLWDRKGLQAYCLKRGYGKKTRGAFVQAWSETYEYVTNQILMDNPEADLVSDGRELEANFLKSAADKEHPTTPEAYRAFFDAVMKEED